MTVTVEQTNEFNTLLTEIVGILRPAEVADYKPCGFREGLTSEEADSAIAAARKLRDEYREQAQAEGAVRPINQQTPATVDGVHTIVASENR